MRIPRVLRQQLWESPGHGPLPGLLLALTAVSGIVDAVSLLRLDRVFVANMTGNVVFAGLGLAGVRGFSVGVAVTALAGFLVGAGTPPLLPASWRSDRARLLRSGMTVKLCLAVPVIVAVYVVGAAPDAAVPYVFTFVLAVSMGLQNGTVQRLGVPELTTTVLTMNLTRLAADLAGPHRRRPENLLRVAAVASLFAGAVVGGVLVLHAGAAEALTLGAVIEAGVALVAGHGARTGAAWTAFPGAA